MGGCIIIYALLPWINSDSKLNNYLNNLLKEEFRDLRKVPNYTTLLGQLASQHHL